MAATTVEDELLYVFLFGCRLLLLLPALEQSGEVFHAPTIDKRNNINVRE